MTRVALVTCAEIPTLDYEGILLQERLIAAGFEVEPAVWTDDSVDWGAFDRVVVRSTWDYTRDPQAFTRWADRVAQATRLDNPAELLAWNSDKHYLADLAAADVPTVPSDFIEPGGTTDHRFAGVEHVVKPAVGAGSLDTSRYSAGDPASAEHIAALLARGRSVTTQPYLPEVDEAGETALIYLGGTLSHSMRKAAILVPGANQANELFVPEEMSRRDASPEERDLGNALVARLPEILARQGVTLERPPLYARVDLLPTSDGPRVLELELTEPSLFLLFVPEAADRFAEALSAS